MPPNFQPPRGGGRPLPITRDFLIDIAGWPTLKQAQAMVDAGHVKAVSYEPPLLSGRIESGGEILITRLKIGSNLASVENLCTCRQAKMHGTVCHHVVSLGLEFLRKKAVAENPASASGAGASGGASPDATRAADSSRVGAPTPPAASVPAKPKWQRYLLGNQPPEARRLELMLLLPLNFSETLQRGDIRVILEGRVEPQTNFQPWDAIAKTKPVAHAVGEEDEALLSFFEGLVSDGGAPASILSVPRAQWAAFFPLIADHPRVWLGKRTQISARRLLRKPRLRLAMQPGGEVTLTLLEMPAIHGQIIDLAPTSRWTWREPVLEEQPFLPAPYNQLEKGPVTLPREGVLAFLTRELPALSQRVTVEHAGVAGGAAKAGVEALAFATLAPEIHVTLDGSLAGLSAQVEAVYPDVKQRYILKPKDCAVPLSSGASASPADSGYQPDPRHAFRFWTRDFRLERAALAQVLAAGFAPGTRQPETFVLAGERGVGDFLANKLPIWRRQWKIIDGPRMVVLMGRLEYIEPSVTLLSEKSPAPGRPRDRFDDLPAGMDRQRSGEDWLSLDIKLTSRRGGVDLSPSEVQQWLQSGSSHRRSGDDRILLLPTHAWSEMQEAMADCDVRQDGGRARVAAKFAPYLTNVLQSQGWDLSTRSTWRLPDAKPALALGDIPPELAKILRPYQQQGVAWLTGLAKHGLNGLLADEMGLGKTLQMLACLHAILRAPGGGAGKSARRALIVCPTSLVENWRREAERFTPGLRVLALVGKDRFERWGQIDEHDIVLTSYALLRRDVDAYREREWTVAVLDEAQHIKNRSSQNAQSAKALRADHRYVLTGTPLENSLFDLWSIYDFLLPGYLGTAKDFKERYETPIAKHQDAAAQERLRHRLRPLFLRRTKDEVASDLPEKIEQISFCELSDEQREVYTALLDQGRREVFSGSGKSGEGKNKLAVLTTLLRLRQACCHLDLLPAKEGAVASRWESPSGKLDHFLELLDEAIDGGHRILVFSQFVKLLQLIRAALEARDLEYCYLDGSTTDRMAQVEKFQNGKAPLFLISLKAGGVGLNLTAADTVIHFDPWWNPAVEDQATARAHRIGQQRVVNAYKLIARGTVEEKILRLQEKKQALIAANVTSDELFVDSLSWDEVQNLFA